MRTGKLGFVECPICEEEMMEKVIKSANVLKETGELLSYKVSSHCKCGAVLTYTEAPVSKEGD